MSQRSSIRESKKTFENNPTEYVTLNLETTKNNNNNNQVHESLIDLPYQGLSPKNSDLCPFNVQLDDALLRYHDFSSKDSNIKLFYKNIRRDKFLLSLNFESDNNNSGNFFFKMMNLKQSIYLALQLNRTLVLPPFFNDYESDYRTINQIIDIENLSNLLPVITLEQFIRKIEFRDHGFDQIIVNDDDDQPSYPKMAKAQKFFNIDISESKVEISKDYQENANFVLWLNHPTIQLSEKLEVWKDDEDMKLTQNQNVDKSPETVVRILLACTRPKEIQRFAMGFIEMFLYLAEMILF